MTVNSFPFGELLKRSWQWTIKNKILWILAFFAGGGSYFLNMSFNSEDLKSFQEFIPRLQSIGDNFSSFVASSGFIILAVTIVVVLGIIFFLLGLAMRASIILSNKQLSLNEKYKFWDLVKKGFSVMPRLLLMSVLWGIPNLVLLLVAVLSVLSIQTMVGKVLLGLTVVLGLLFNIYLSLLRQNAYCFAVLESNSAWGAIVNAIKLLNKNFWVLVIAALIEIGLGIGIGLGLILTLIVIAIPFVVLGGILMFAVGSAGILVPLFLGAIVVLAVTAILRGATSFFFNAFLTNVYWEIKKPNTTKTLNVG